MKWIAYREYDTDDQTGEVDRDYIRPDATPAGQWSTKNQAEAQAYKTQREALGAVRDLFPRRVSGVRLGAVKITDESTSR